MCWLWLFGLALSHLPCSAMAEQPPAGFLTVAHDAGWLPILDPVITCTVRRESDFRSDLVVPDPTAGDPTAKAGGYMQLNNGTDALGVDPGFGMEAVDTDRWTEPRYNLNYGWRFFEGRLRYYYATNGGYGWAAFDKAMSAWSTWWNGDDGGCRKQVYRPVTLANDVVAAVIGPTHSNR